ncbi:MAG: OmpA family protein [Alphaproteobacteria bacterium]|mgnify:CR=1 FL=1
MTPAPAQVASRPPAKAADTRLLFTGETTELPEAAKQSLNGVIAKMQADEELRVQFVAYASGPADQAAKARRVSLSRALAARAYVLEKGVRSTRIDVRALGNAGEDSPTDCVDVILTK